MKTAAKSATADLFGHQEIAEENVFSPDPVKQVALGQFPTPYWAALALVERHFSDLGASDFVIEPCCGPGAFLQALPDCVQALGVDIDPHMVKIARANTGRRIIQGDFRSVLLDADVRPTAIISNPPFNLEVIDGILDRAHTMLPKDGRVGMILPAYAFQTASRLAGYNERWSIEQEMVPRNIYHGLSIPLLFAKFIKDGRRALVGFSLYYETVALHKMPKPYREVLNGLTKSVWVTAVTRALANLGSRANLQALYAEIEGKRPSETAWWREKIRQVLRQFPQVFRAEGDGWYSLA